MSSPAEPDRPSTPASESPPPTGQAAVDAALAGVADLEDAPLDEHAERLARAHETLHGQLQGDQSG